MSIGALDRDLAVPLYHQLQNILKAEIEMGRWRPDERLPSEQELGERFQVSKITVRQALTDLAQSGYIRGFVRQGGDYTCSLKYTKHWQLHA